MNEPIEWGNRFSKVRHKCSYCGKVRFEKYLKTKHIKTRFGHEVWICIFDCRADWLRKIHRTLDFPDVY